MDLIKHFSSAEAERRASLKESENVRLICPQVQIADDESSSFAVMTIANFADFLQMEGRARVVGAIDIGNSAIVRMLEMLTTYSDVVDVKVVVLTDVPGADYDFEFQKAVAKFESVSYVRLVDSLIEERQRAKDDELEKKSTKHHAEIRSQTRSNGTVKEFTAFDKPVTTDDLDAIEDDANGE